MQYLSGRLFLSGRDGDSHGVRSRDVQPCGCAGVQRGSGGNLHRRRRFGTRYVSGALEQRSGLYLGREFDEFRQYGHGNRRAVELQ